MLSCMISTHGSFSNVKPGENTPSTDILAASFHCLIPPPLILPYGLPACPRSTSSFYVLKLSAVNTPDGLAERQGAESMQFEGLLT